MQITVLPLNRTSSSRSQLNFNNNQACFRQEVEENTEKEVQATPIRTISAVKFWLRLPSQRTPLRLVELNASDLA